MITYYVHAGRRCGGMASHVPNAVMTRDNRVQRLTVNLPTPMEAVSMYRRDGGRLSDGASFGEDPLQGDVDKCTIRQQAFTDSFPSFELIFHRLVNSDHSLFTSALKLYIDITYRLSRT